MSHIDLAKKLKAKYKREETVNAIRKRIESIRKWLEAGGDPKKLYPGTKLKQIIPGEDLPEVPKHSNKSESKTKSNTYESDVPLMPSAWDSDNNRFYTVEEYCDKYGLRKDLIKSSKLVAHIGSHMIYNIVFKEEIHDIDDFDYMAALDDMFKSYKRKPSREVKGDGEGVITITDLHFGAYVLDLNLTQNFSVHILIEMLEKAARQVNRLKYKKVHVHMLGDLIESFTGMNHPNVWQSLQYGMYGANVIKQFVSMIDKHFLQRINNLGSIKIIAGNHDRATIKKDVDSHGWAADLISYCLELIGYDTEFSSSVLKHTVGDITYILNHGHLGLTKLTTEEICWKYGVKGNFNFVMEGHLHSRISKLNGKAIKEFKLISDDRADCRRQICASLFTGNGYSENLGYSTTPGFTVTESNGAKGVNVFDFSL